MLMRLALTALLIFSPFGAVFAQASPEAQLAAGDRAHEARNAKVALAYYEAVIAADSGNYAALWRASRDAVDLGESAPDAATRNSLLARAEDYARRAVAVNPDDAEGHFALARALGRMALTLGNRDRVRYASDVRAAALEALRLDPEHAGALHVMGVWNAEVMRLSGLERFFAKNLLGGRVFGQASWNEAARYLERAVELDPNRITHRLDLARVYLDVDSVERALEQLAVIDTLPIVDFNDALYKREAARLAERVR